MKKFFFVGDYNLPILINCLEGAVNIPSVLIDFIDYILFN